MNKTLFILAGVLAVGAANAIFVDAGYAGGTQLVTNGVATVTTSTGNLDDGAWTIVMANGFDFYCTGSPVNTFAVTTNGMLNFGAGTTDFTNTALNVADQSTRYIAPLWDDFNLALGNSPSANAWARDTANFFSYTVTGVRRFGALPSETASDFQAILVKSNTVIGGHSFLAGDIVFGYNAIGAFAAPDATSGVKYSNTQWTETPGGNGFGLFDVTTASNLPTDNRFVRFSWQPGNSTGPGRYVASTVPEPGTMAALGLGVAAMIRRRRNRK